MRLAANTGAAGEFRIAANDRTFLDACAVEHPGVAQNHRRRADIRGRGYFRRRGNPAAAVGMDCAFGALEYVVHLAHERQSAMSQIWMRSGGEFPLYALPGLFDRRVEGPALGRVGRRGENAARGLDAERGVIIVVIETHTVGRIRPGAGERGLPRISLRPAAAGGI